MSLALDDVVEHTSSLGTMEHKYADAAACAFCNDGPVGSELRDRIERAEEKVKTYVCDAVDAYYRKLSRESFARLDAAGKIVTIEPSSREGEDPTWEIAATHCRHGSMEHHPTEHGPLYPTQACADCLAAVKAMFAAIEAAHPSFPPFSRGGKA